MEFLNERTKTADKLSDAEVYKFFTETMFKNMEKSCPHRNPGNLGSDPYEIIKKIQSDPSIYDTLPTYFKNNPIIAYEASKTKFSNESKEYITIPSGTQDNVKIMRNILISDGLKRVEELPDEMKRISISKKSILENIRSKK